MNTLTRFSGSGYGKYLTRLMLFFSLVSGGTVLAQSNRTPTFTGNIADFNAAERFAAAANNTTYGITFDGTYIYFGAFRTVGSFGSGDNFAIYIDTDPRNTLTAGNGTTAGRLYNNFTPTLPFNADYTSYTEQSYTDPLNRFNGSWASTGVTPTTFTSSTAREVRIALSDLGNPASVYVTVWMGYNGGIFSNAPGSSNEGGGATRTMTGFFGSFPVYKAGITPVTFRTQNTTTASGGGTAISNLTVAANTSSNGDFGDISISGTAVWTNSGTSSFSGTCTLTGTTSAIALGTNTLSVGGRGVGGSAGTLTFNNTAAVPFNGTNVSTARLNFLGSGLVNGSNPTRVFGPLCTVNLAGGVDFTSNTSVVQGILQISAGGFVNTNAPAYGSASTLTYNVNGSYGRGAEWGANGVGTIGVTAGFPNNVNVGSGTNYTLLDLENGAAGTARACNGILTILGVAGANARLSMGAMTQRLTVGGNLLIGGAAFTATGANTNALVLSSAAGGDLYLRGNWTNNFGTINQFVPNGRAVAFEGTGTQSITRAGGETFDYMIIQKATTSTIVQLSSAVTINGSSGDVLQFLDNQGGGSGKVGILNLNNQTLTLANDGGNIFVSGANHQIYSSTGTGAVLAITGNKNIVDDATGSRTFLWGSNGSGSGTTINIRVNQGKTLTIGNGSDITFRTSNSAAGLSTILLQTSGGTSPTGKVVLSSGATMSIGGASAFGINGTSGGRLEVNGTFTNTGGSCTFNQPGSNTLSATNPGTYFTSTGVWDYASTSGTISAAATTLQFQASSRFNLKTSGGTIPTANWDAASNLYLQNTGTASVGGFNSQTFGNVFLDHTQSGVNLINGAATFTVAGNFTVQNTGSTNFNTANNTVSMTLSGASSAFSINKTGATAPSFTMNTNTGSTTIAITTGTFNISDGTFTGNTSTASTTTLTVGGNFNQTGGTVNCRSNTGSITINITGNYAMSVPDGVTATFELGSASTGTTTLVLRGNFSQSRSGTTGTGVFQRTSGTFNLTFNGSSSQAFNAPGAGMTNTAMTAINTINVNNTGTAPSNVITVNENLTAGAITLTAGILQMGAQTLTFTGNVAALTTLATAGSASRFIASNAASGGFLWSPTGVTLTTATYNFPVGYVTSGGSTTNCYRPVALALTITTSTSSNNIKVGYAATGTGTADADNVPTSGNIRSQYILKVLVSNITTFTSTLNVTGIVPVLATTSEFNATPNVGPSGARMYAWSWSGSAWTAVSSPATAGSNPITFTAFNPSLTSGATGSFAFGNPGASFGGIKVWNTAGTTAWATGSNWIPSGAPSSTDNVTIDAGGTQPTVTGSGNAANSIANAGTLTLAAGSVLDVSGTLTNSGTVSGASTSEVNFNNAGNQTILAFSGSPTTNFGNLRISGTGIKTLSSGASAVSVANTLFIQPGANFQLPGTGTVVTAFTVNNIYVQTGGIFDIAATATTTNFTNTMTVTGNIRNAGTFDLYKLNGGTNYAVCNVTYSGTNQQTVYSPGGSTTRFNRATVNKTAMANKVVVKANPCVFMDATTGLNVTSGTYEQWYGTMPILAPTSSTAFGSNSRVVFGSDPASVDSTVAPDVSTMSTVSGTRYGSTSGQIDVNTSGTVTFRIYSSASNTGFFLNGLGITHTWKKGTVQILGGYFNMRAAATSATKQTLNLTGANLIINPDGWTGSNPTGFPYFGINIGGTFNVFNMTSGSVTLLGINPAASATAADVWFEPTNGGEWNVTGGTFILGNGASTSLAGNKGSVSIGPSASNTRNFWVNLGGSAFHNLTLDCAGGASTVAGIRMTGSTGINGTLTLTSGGFFDLGTNGVAPSTLGPVNYQTLTIGKADGTGGAIVNTAGTVFCSTDGAGTTNTTSGTTTPRAPCLVINGVDDVTFNNAPGMYLTKFTLNRKLGTGQTVTMANGISVHNNNTFQEYALSTLFANYTGVFTKSKGILAFTTGGLVYSGLTPTLCYASSDGTNTGAFNNGVGVMDATDQEWPSTGGPVAVALDFSHPTHQGTLNMPVGFARTVKYFLYMSGNRTFNSNLSYANDPGNHLRYFNIAGVNTTMSAEEFPATGGPCNLVISVNSDGLTNTGSTVTNTLGARTLTKISGAGGNYFSRFGTQIIGTGSSLTVQGVLCGSPFSTSSIPDASGAGKVVMSGPDANQISGGYFANLEVNNPLGCTINGTTSLEAQVVNNTLPVQLHVTGNLTLTDGIISTSAAAHKLSIYNPILGGTAAQIASRISSSLQLTVEGTGTKILLPPVTDLGRLEVRRANDGSGFAATLSANLALLDYNPAAPNGYYYIDPANGLLEASSFQLLQNFIIPTTQTATAAGICAVGSVNNVTVNSGATLQVDCNITINGKLILEGNADAVSSGGAISFGPNGTLRTESSYSGTFNSFIWPTGGGASDLKSLEVAGSTSLTLPASFSKTLQKNLIIESGSTLNVGSNTVSVNNDFSNAGTYAASAGKITLTGKVGTPHNISGAGTFNGRIEVNNTTVGASVGSSPLTLAGDVLLTGPGSDLLIPGGRTLNFSGNSAGGGGSFVGSTTSTLVVGGTGNVTLPPIDGGLLGLTINRASGVVSPGSDIQVQNVVISNGRLDPASSYSINYVVGKTLTYNSNANTTGLEWPAGVAPFITLTVNSGAGNTITLGGSGQRYDISSSSVTITSGNLALGGASSNNTLDFHNGSTNNAIQASNRLTISAGAQLQIAGNTLIYNPGATVGQTRFFNAGSLANTITSTSNSRLEIGGNGAAVLPSGISALKTLKLTRVPDGFTSGWLHIPSSLTIADSLIILDGNVFNGNVGPVNNLTMGSGSRIYIGSNGETLSGDYNAAGAFSAAPVAASPAVGYSVEYHKTTTTGRELISTMAKVLVGAGRTVTLNKSTTLTDSLKVLSGATLLDGSVSNTLSGQGHVLNMGTVTVTSPNYVTLNGSSLQTLSGKGTYNRLSTSNAAGFSLAGSATFGRSDVTISEQLNLGAGTFNLNTGILRYDGGIVSGTPANMVATSGQAALAIGGNSALVLSTGVTSLDSLGLFNSNHLTVSHSFSVNKLGFGVGKVIMNSGTLTYNGASTAPSSSSSYVGLKQGASFRWNNLPAVNASYKFPVGPDEITTTGAPLSGYRPFSIAYTPTAGSNLTVAFAAHPNPTTLSGTTESPANVSMNNGSLIDPVIRSNYQLIFTPSVAITGATLTMESQSTDYNDGTLSPPDEGLSIFTNLRTTAGYHLAPYLNTTPNMWTRFGRSSNGTNGSNTTILKSGLNMPNLQHTLVLGLANPPDLQYGTSQVYTWNPNGPSTNFGTGLNWDLGSVPDDITHDIVIVPGSKQPVLGIGEQYSVGSSNIDPGASLTVNGTLLVNGTIFNTTGTFNGGSGTVKFVRLLSDGQSIEGSGQTRFNNLTISSAGTLGTKINATNNVSVIGTLSLTGTSKFNLNNNIFTLRSTAAGTGRIAALTTPANLQNATQVRMQRYVPINTSSWYFLGTPIQGQTVSDWGDNFDIYLPYPASNCIQIGVDHTNIFELKGDTIPTGKELNEINGWRIPKSPSSVPVGKGFRTFLKGANFLSYSKTFDNVGVPTTGNFTFTVPYSATGYNGGGWNLVANPYPSAIDWDAASGWTRTNMGLAIYIWNGAANQYGSYVSGLGTNGATNIIPSSQGFMVRVNASPTFAATENVKTATNGSFIRTNVAQNFLRMKMVSGGISDEAIIRFSPEATELFDDALDASKLSGFGINFGITQVDGMRNSIHSIPMPVSQTIIPLFAETSVNGSFKIVFDLENLDLGTGTLYLKDNYLGSIQEVTGNIEYAFNVNSDPASQGGTRFELIFSVESVTEIAGRVGSFESRVVPNPGNGRKLTVVLRNATEVQSHVVITDMIGKVLVDKAFSSIGSQIQLEANLPMGVYQVLVENGGKTSIQKIVVNQ